MPDFPPIYPCSEAEARRLGEHDEWEQSFRQNVSCARGIEIAIRACFDQDANTLADGCADHILRKYGFKRTHFVLANSVRDLPYNADVSSDNAAWCRELYLPDGVKNRYFEVDTAYGLLDQFISQTRASYETLHLFDGRHCSSEEDYEGKVLILSPSVLKESCWSEKNQLWLAESGFGCDPGKSGRAVYAICLGDGEKARWNRADFLGVIREECLPDWAREKLEKLKNGQTLETPEDHTSEINMTIQ